MVLSFDSHFPILHRINWVWNTNFTMIKFIKQSSRLSRKPLDNHQLIFLYWKSPIVFENWKWIINIYSNETTEAPLSSFSGFRYWICTMVIPLIREHCKQYLIIFTWWLELALWTILVGQPMYIRRTRRTKGSTGKFKFSSEFSPFSLGFFSFYFAHFLSFSFLEISFRFDNKRKLTKYFMIAIDFVRTYSRNEQKTTVYLHPNSIPIYTISQSWEGSKKRLHRFRYIRDTWMNIFPLFLSCLRLAACGMQMKFSTKDINNYSRNNFMWAIKCERGTPTMSTRDIL